MWWAGFYPTQTSGSVGPCGGLVSTRLRPVAPWDRVVGWFLPDSDQWLRETVRWVGFLPDSDQWLRGTVWWVGFYPTQTRGGVVCARCGCSEGNDPRPDQRVDDTAAVPQTSSSASRTLGSLSSRPRWGTADAEMKNAHHHPHPTTPPKQSEVPSSKLGVKREQYLHRW